MPTCLVSSISCLLLYKPSLSTKIQNQAEQSIGSDTSFTFTNHWESPSFSSPFLDYWTRWSQVDLALFHLLHHRVSNLAHKNIRAPPWSKSHSACMRLKVHQTTKTRLNTKDGWKYESIIRRERKKRISIFAFTSLFYRHLWGRTSASRCSGHCRGGHARL